MKPCYPVVLMLALVVYIHGATTAVLDEERVLRTLTAQENSINTIKKALPR